MAPVTTRSSQPELYRYRLNDTDGESVCDVRLATPVEVGAEISLGPGRKLRVLSAVRVGRRDDDVLALLTVEAA